MTIGVTAGGETLTNKAEASPGVQMLRTDGQVSQITYKLSGTSGATLYGAAFEGEKGVVIDNMSLRGSGGGNLASIPLETLKDFARLRPYDLIVFQFGLNVCSNRSSEAGLKAYIASMDKVIANFREAYPDAAILIVSMPDRDQRTANGIHTIPQVKTLVHLQEGMALDHKVAFFNLFECMGGDDAMKGLVEKGLGQKDYTHMNYKGGTELAGRMFQSFQGGLANHKRRIGETRK